MTYYKVTYKDKKGIPHSFKATLSKDTENEELLRAMLVQRSSLNHLKPEDLKLENMGELKGAEKAKMSGVVSRISGQNRVGTNAGTTPTESK